MPICYGSAEFAGEASRAVQERIRRGRRAPGRECRLRHIAGRQQDATAPSNDPAPRATASSISARATCRRPCPRSRHSRGLRAHLALHRPPAGQQDPAAWPRQFAWVHGVDRLRIAERLSEQRPFHAPPLNVCLQVNIGGERTQGGVDAAELPRAGARPWPRCRGLQAARAHVHAAAGGGRVPRSAHWFARDRASSCDACTCPARRSTPCPWG